MIKLLLVVVVAEGLVELITSSQIADILFKNRLRTRLHYLRLECAKNNTSSLTKDILSFCDKVTSCGYCCSVWVSFFLALDREWWLFNYYLLNVFVLHRLSNYIHVCIELVRRGRVHTHDISLKLEHIYENENPDKG